jgi:putative peptidoglycan lipid II flippase
MALAAIFGAGQVFDAFAIAFRIPNLTRDLFAEGALSSAFVPTFTDYLSSKSREQAAALANLVATAIIVVVGSICLLGVIFSPQLVMFIAPGFLQTPGKFEMTVNMTRIMFPFLLLVALAAQAMGILNACNQFGVPAMASTFFNLVSITSGLGLGWWLAREFGINEIYGMAWGVVIGGAAQLLWQMPSLHRAGFRFRPQFDWSHPGLRQILWLMGPAILGNAAVQVNVTVNSNLASRLGDGPVSWLGYAFRFMQLPIGIFGVAIASATLPAISRSAAAGDLEQFRRTLSRSTGIVFVLTVPSAVGLAVLGHSIVGAIYELRRFTSVDTAQTAQALACYAIGLVGYAAAKVLNPAFYALKDSRTPMVVSLCSIGINLVVALTLIYGLGFGHASLALSTSAVAIFSAVTLFAVMRARIGGIYGRNLWRTFSRVTMASAAMGIAVYSSSQAVRWWMGTSKLGYATDLAVSIPVGLVVLYAGCRLLQVSELDTALQTIAGPIRRRIPFLRAKITSENESRS